MKGVDSQCWIFMNHLHPGCVSVYFGFMCAAKPTLSIQIILKEFSETEEQDEGDPFTAVNTLKVNISTLWLNWTFTAVKYRNASDKPPVISLFSACYQPVISLFSACFQPVISLLSACFQPVISLLSACFQLSVSCSELQFQVSPLELL